MKPSDNTVPATAQTDHASAAATAAMQAGQYRYAGPMSGVTLADGQQVMLCPGGVVTLPAAHDYTQTLLALGHLTPVAQPTPAKESNHAS
jgi:hypothetical protein